VNLVEATHIINQPIHHNPLVITHPLKKKEYTHYTGRGIQCCVLNNHNAIEYLMGCY
jgi:hypothetical protein